MDVYADFATWLMKARLATPITALLVVCLELGGVIMEERNASDALMIDKWSPFSWAWQ